MEHSNCVLRKKIWPLNLASNAAEGLLTDPQIGGYIAQRHSFENVRRRFHEDFITLFGIFKMIAYKPLLQHHIVLFMRQPAETFYVWIFVIKILELFICKAPK